MSAKRCASLLAPLLLGGCGYVGDPLPPSLGIPTQVIDLQVVEHADQLRVTFTAPSMATDAVPLKRLEGVELTAEGEPLPTPEIAPGQAVSLAFPASQYVGRTLQFRVRLASSAGKWSEWSNPAGIEVIPPMTAPQGLRVAAAPEGVRISWSDGVSVRIRRKGPGDSDFSVVADSASGGEWIDRNAVFGQTYEYAAQSFRENRESEWSPTMTITPADTFPPEPPKGLAAVTGIGSIELTWDRSPESDVAGYRVLRADAGSDSFAPVGDMVVAPNYSDHDVTPGAVYRYVVVCLDRSGNQSEPSGVVQATAP